MLASLLKNRNQTQHNIAKLMGVTQQAVSLWCKGVRTPRLKQMHILSQILCVTPQEVFECFNKV